MTTPSPFLLLCTSGTTHRASPPLLLEYYNRKHHIKSHFLTLSLHTHTHTHTHIHTLRLSATGGQICDCGGFPQQRVKDQWRYWFGSYCPVESRWRKVSCGWQRMVRFYCCNHGNWNFSFVSFLGSHYHWEKERAQFSYRFQLPSTITYFVAILVERLPMSNFTELQIADRIMPSSWLPLMLIMWTRPSSSICSGSLGTRLWVATSSRTECHWCDAVTILHNKMSVRICEWIREKGPLRAKRKNLMVFNL